MSTLIPRLGGVVHTPADTIDVLGMTVQVKGASVTTNGAWSLMEWSVPPYCAGVPLHWHARTEKVCYMLGGTLAFTLDQQMFTAIEHESVVIPPGVRHCFFNPSAEPATLLILCFPGGVERYVADALRLAAPSRMEQYDHFYDSAHD